MILKLLMLGIWMVFVPLGTGYFALSVSGTIGWKNGTGSKNGGDVWYALGLGYILI